MQDSQTLERIEQVLAELCAQRTLASQEHANSALYALVVLLEQVKGRAELLRVTLPLSAAVCQLLALYGRSSNICRSGCRALTFLASPEVAYGGAASAAIQVLHLHSTSLDVLLEGLLAAATLTGASAVHADAAVTAHAVDAATTAMREHPDCVLIQVCGCRLLANSFSGSSNPMVIKLAADEARAVGASSVVNNAVRTNPHNADVLRTACDAISELVEHGVLADDERGAAEAGRCVANALRFYGMLRSSNLLEAAAMALHKILADSPEALAGFEDADGIESLCAALREPTHTLDDLSFGFASFGLTKLLGKCDGKRLRRAAGAGALRVLAGELQRTQQNKGLQRGSIQCVGLLLNTPGMATFAAEARVLEAIVSAMSRAPTNAYLQRGGAVALSAAADCNNLFVGADADRVGMIRVLLTAMRTHATDEDTLRVCLCALSNLCAEDDIERLASSLGSHAAIVEVFKSQHAGNADVMTDALVTLRNLSIQPEGKLAARDSGSLEAVVQVLKRHLQSVAVATRACGALAVLLNDTPNEAILGRCGALSAITEVLRSHGRSCRELTAYACLALARGTVLPETEVLGGDAGAISALVSAMKDFPNDAEILEHALDALRNLSINGPNKRRIANARALPAVVLAMEQNLKTADVQAAGCYAIAYACCNNPEGEAAASAACRASAVSAGAYSAVAAAMAAHPQHAKLNGFAVRAMREMLFYKEDLSRWASRGSGKALLPELLLTTMQRFLGDVELVRYGCGLLATMFEAMPYDTPPPDLGLAIIAVLGKHSYVDEVCVLCMSLIAQLLACKAHAPSQHKEPDTGLLTVTLNVFCNHVRGGPVCMNTAPVLYMLLANDAHAQRFAIACDVPKLLRKILRTIPQHGPVSVAEIKLEQPFFEKLKALLSACQEAHGEACAEPGCALCGMQPGRCGAAGCTVRDGGDVILKRCASCRTATYCSTAHQRDAWPTHKHVCRMRAAVLAAHAALANQKAST